MSPEFNLIQEYFTRPTQHTTLGVGDDAALIALNPNMELAISADMLVAGTHFFSDCDPYGLGWKSLAVNISDIAAMGAQAKWATLAIALPDINQSWLAEFSSGFFACANTFGVDLIGGDTTRGPLTISVQIMGEVAKGHALKRSGAAAGDTIWVTGALGSSALGLAYLKNTTPLNGDVLNCCLNALHQPTPRTALGLKLQGIATSCIDISDGLLADLGHILKASHTGASLSLEAIPCIAYVREHLSEPAFQQYVLAGGDDYELCFTAPARVEKEILALSQTLNLPISPIGHIHEGEGITVSYQGKALQIEKKGYDHFD